MRSGAAGLMARLRADLDGLAALDPAALSDVELLDVLGGLQPLVCQAEAVRSRLIALAHRRGSATVDGAASTVAWLRNRLRLGDAGSQLRVATGLDRLPAVAQAYQRGEVSFQHAAALVDVAQDITTEVLDAGADKLLADQAATLPPGPTRRMAMRVRDHFDPQAAERRTTRLYGDRWLTLHPTFHGAVAIQGVLDPDGGRLVRATLAALTPPAQLDDERTPAARRADALVQACRLAADAAPQTGGHKPHVTVTLDWETLRDQVSAAPDRGATLDDGAALSPRTARRLACDATLIPAVLGAASEPLDIGRATRVVPTALRRALALRDRGCRFAGCDRPLSWVDAHHLRHWADGGVTRLENLVLLCRAHHTAVHEGGWSIILDPATNTVTVTHHTGRQHTSRPPSRPP